MVFKLKIDRISCMLSVLLMSVVIMAQSPRKAPIHNHHLIYFPDEPLPPGNNSNPLSIQMHQGNLLMDFTDNIYRLYRIVN